MCGWIRVYLDLPLVQPALQQSLVLCLGGHLGLDLSFLDGTDVTATLEAQRSDEALDLGKES